MRFTRTARVSVPAAAVVLALLPGASALAQSWQDAFKRGDYAAAAALLGPIVFHHEASGDARYPDARAVQTLGRMYASGLGVRRDPVIACGLFGLATGSAVYQHGDTHDVTVATRRLLDEECVKLTVDERREGAKLAACPSLAAEPQTLVLGPAHRVEVIRGIIRIQHAKQRRDWWLGDFVECASPLRTIRYTSVKPPRGSKLRARHFLEVFTSRGDRAVEWRAIEIRGAQLTLAARTALDGAEAVVAPRMLGTGQVRWKTVGGSGQRVVESRVGKGRTR